MRVNQQNLWLLRRVQEKIQHQALEDFYGLLQLLANCSHH